MTETKSGKRKSPGDGGEFAESPAKRQRVDGRGLHRFVRSMSAPPEMRAVPAARPGTVTQRFDEFVSAAVSLGGAKAFGNNDDGQDQGVAAYYRDICAAYISKFDKAFSEVLKDIPSLDEKQQALLVKMGCQVRGSDNSRDPVTMMLRHDEEFEASARSHLLKEAINSFERIPVEERAERELRLSKASERGDLGKPHVAALRFSINSDSRMPDGSRKYLSTLLQQIQAPKDGSSYLEKMPPEILQKILMHTVEDELREDIDYKSVAETIDSINLTSNTLRLNAREVGLPDLRSNITSAESSLTERYQNFRDAMQRMLDFQQGDLVLNHTEEDHALMDFGHKAQAVISVIGQLTPEAQSHVIGQCCKLGRREDVGLLMVLIAEHQGDLKPLPRSEMLMGLIQTLPYVTSVANTARGYRELAKAYLAGDLKQQHRSAIHIVGNTHGPDLGNHLDQALDDLAAESLVPSSELAVPKEPRVPKNAAAPKFEEARLALLKKLDDRSYSR